MAISKSTPNGTGGRRLAALDGLRFLAASQSQDGTWHVGEPGPGMRQGLENAAQADGSWASAGKQGPGVTALALLAFLASGEDANFGVYSGQIRKALRSLIGAQDANTGYIGPSMYHHGFAMLALAEAYGAVDDRNLWPGEKAPRSVGQALELAVRPLAGIDGLQKSRENLFQLRVFRWLRGFVGHVRLLSVAFTRFAVRYQCSRQVSAGAARIS